MKLIKRIIKVVIKARVNARANEAKRQQKKAKKQINQLETTFDYQLIKVETTFENMVNKIDLGYKVAINRKDKMIEKREKELMREFDKLQKVRIDYNDKKQYLLKLETKMQNEIAVTKKQKSEMAQKLIIMIADDNVKNDLSKKIKDLVVKEEWNDMSISTRRQQTIN